MAADRSLGTRLTAKVGPLPVWVWAVVILVGGYLAYRLMSNGSSSTAASSTTADTSTGTDTTSTPDTGAAATTDLGSAGGVTSGDGSTTDTGLSDTILSQLQGVGSSIDALTQAVQSQPAFWPGSGDSGSGSVVPNTGDGGVVIGGNRPASTTPAKPAPAVKAPATVRYYTFKPGQAPKDRKKDEAPAHGPAGTTLHFQSGKGYFYA